MNGNDAAPSPASDVEECKRQLSKWGYCILRDAISPEQRMRTLDRLKEQAELECEKGLAYLSHNHSSAKKTDGGAKGTLTHGRWIGSPPSGQTATAWQGVTALLNKGRVFVDLAMNESVHQIAAHAFDGYSFDLSTMRGLIQRKGCAAGAMHIDQVHIPFRTPIPVQINAMIALSDFTAENGATLVVPGSHVLNPPHLGGDPSAADERPMEAPAGSAIVWESRTWHRAGACTTDEPRFSIAMAFGQSFLRQQDVYSASLHDDVYFSLSDKERAIAGFSAPIGLNRIYPRFPGDRASELAEGGNPYVPELRRDLYA